MQENIQKAGFIAVVGRPNAGKSSLLNWLVDEKIAMVSKKANATRKRSNIIVMHKNAQLIFVDTPGIHEKERALNKFMLNETLKAIGDCDLILFLTPIHDSLQNYEKFLHVNKDKDHIILLTKTDQATNKQILDELNKYNQYSDRYKAIFPISIKNKSDKNYFLDLIVNFIPNHPFLYDPEIITTQMIKEVYKEFIREAIFENTSDEVPYSTDVKIDQIEENENLERIFATIIVEKESQKAIIIGKEATTLKRIGKYARVMIEKLSGKKVYLRFNVMINKNWTKNEQKIKKLNYCHEK